MLGELGCNVTWFRVEAEFRKLSLRLSRLGAKEWPMVEAPKSVLKPEIVTDAGRAMELD